MVMRAAYEPPVSWSWAGHLASCSRDEVRPHEVLALEQQRQVSRPGKDVGSVVAQVERGRLLPLPKLRNPSHASLAWSASCAITFMPARAIRASSPAQALLSPARTASTMLVSSRLTVERKQRSSGAAT